MSGTHSGSQCQYAVVGTAVDDSLSPYIHDLFAKSMGQQCSYGRMSVSEADASSVIQHFFAAGGKGLSVTMPFKGLAYQLADRAHPRAQSIAAANTLTRDTDGAIVADNTDGLGCYLALSRLLAGSWHSKRVLLVGAGGAAKAVLPVLMARHPAVIVVANRTESRAMAMISQSHYRKPCLKVSVQPLDHTPDQPYDLIIQAAGSGLSGEQLGLSPDCLDARTVVYDLSYGFRSQPFLRWAQEQGATTCSDGLSMLVAQAAYQHSLWQGVMPDLAQTMKALLLRESA